MHLAYEHLDELIIEHGPFQHGNDEILEKGLHRPASNPRPTHHAHTHAHPTTYYPLDDPPLLMFFNHLSVQRVARALAPTSPPTSPHLTPPSSSLAGNRDMKRQGVIIHGIWASIMYYLYYD